MDVGAFFELHRDLPREGPGEPADVAWAAEVAGIARDAQVCDAACGPGADIAALLQAVPEGHVTALDKTAHFVEAAEAAWAGDPRVRVQAGDMAALPGTYDFIWCAGAVYFLGVPQALEQWRDALTPGGVIAFSEPCYFTSERPERLQAHWQYPQMQDEAGIRAWVEHAGYEVLGTRRLSDAAWEAYYTPLEVRIAALRADASPALAEVLDEGAEEIACWRETRALSGYLLSVVRPV
ncbi:class I SAM-dependent methyltransferase [Pseudaestuariivita sp.]|uniref:class I SAM-dependent methyltransferase n=1 Tax=Pseudaestuariivita sp. TaxID=2211669 RepID=UPI00405A0379